MEGASNACVEVRGFLQENPATKMARRPFLRRFPGFRHCFAISSAKEGASFGGGINAVSFRRKLTGTKYHGGDFVPSAPPIPRRGEFAA